MTDRVNISLEANKDELLEDVDEEEPSRGRRGAKTDEAGRKIKGRGFKEQDRDVEERYGGKGGDWDMIDDGGKAGPLRCE